MATGGNALKFVVEIQNKQAIEELTGDIKDQEEAIRKLNTQLKAGTINESQFTAAAVPLGEHIRKANIELKELKTASGMGTQGLIQLGYAADDLQYGFTAIVNNIPQILMGFGVSSGIAGAAAIAGVAINQLVKHWGELSDIAQSAWSGGSVEQLQKLREAAEKATEAFDKLTKEHTKAQEASLKFVHEGIVEGGVGEILRGLAYGVASEPGLRAEETVRDKMNRAMHTTPIEDQLLEGQLTKRLDEENRQKAAQMLVAINQGDKIAMATARRWARGNPGAFPKDFRDKLDPEGAEAEANRLANLDATRKGNKNVRQAEKEAEREKLQMNEELTKKGMQFEEEMKKEELTAEKKALQEKIKAAEHALTPRAKQQLQDMLLGTKAPHQSEVLSTKAFVNKMMTGAMNAIPQKQLDTLKGMHDNLKSIDKKILDLGKLG